MAGKRAKASTANAAALNYLAAGLALLAEGSWERRYDLIFRSETHRAECELLTADLAAAEERLTMLSRRAGNSRRHRRRGLLASDAVYDLGSE